MILNIYYNIISYYNQTLLGWLIEPVNYIITEVNNFEYMTSGYLEFGRLEKFRFDKIQQ